MRLIGKAVLKRAGTAFEGLNNFAGYKHCSERCVSARNPLPYKDHVGLDSPMLDRERLTGSAHAGHDFVGDEEDVVAATDLGDANGIAIWGSRRSQRCTDDRLENEGGDRLTIVFRVVCIAGLEQRP